MYEEEALLWRAAIFVVSEFMLLSLSPQIMKPTDLVGRRRYGSQAGK
jgi:hypothetical protein